MLGLLRSAQLQVGVQQDMRDFRHAVLLFFQTEDSEVSLQVQMQDETMILHINALRYIV